METVVVLDFGAQYSQLIARRVREAGVYCTIVPFNRAFESLADLKPCGLIFSGGPSSVFAEGAPLPDMRIFEMGVPILGICYGHQLIGHLLGGKVEKSNRREYGPAMLRHNDSAGLFAGLDTELKVWMSHGDKVTALPPGFEKIGETDNSLISAMADRRRRFYGVQFHPEVIHTPRGKEILRNFVLGVCGCSGDWSMRSFVERSLTEIRQTVGNRRVLCALSGGVDSSVLAVLLHEAIGDQLVCVFVNNGLLRKGEAEMVQKVFRQNFHIRLIYVDATERFLTKLRSVEDPERKRKIIGSEFIEVFADEARKLGDFQLLAQGTIYPDVIESVSAKGGPSATIKSHHNVGGLPERMHMELLEPLRELFKDEVRRVGEELGLPEEILWRHPFPGPGLAVRVIGEVTPERLAVLREADAVAMQEIRAAGLYRSIAQAFTVLLPIKSVGVMGDERTYENVLALRAVTTEDFMTADWFRFPDDVLARISGRIINEVKGVNRVLYDISTKPPSTIEWE